MTLDLEPRTFERINFFEINGAEKKENTKNRESRTKKNRSEVTVAKKMSQILKPRNFERPNFFQTAFLNIFPLPRDVRVCKHSLTATLTPTRTGTSNSRSIAPKRAKSRESRTKKSRSEATVAKRTSRVFEPRIFGKLLRDKIFGAEIVHSCRSVRPCADTLLLLVKLDTRKKKFIALGVTSDASERFSFPL